jgi:hypothetical protein
MHDGSSSRCCQCNITRLFPPRRAEETPPTTHARRQAPLPHRCPAPPHQNNDRLDHVPWQREVVADEGSVIEPDGGIRIVMP